MTYCEKILGGLETMPFSDEITKQINEYCLRDLPLDSWYLQEFDFILDNLLRTRIIQEFKNIRYI